MKIICYLSGLSLLVLLNCCYASTKNNNHPIHHNTQQHHKTQHIKKHANKKKPSYPININSADIKQLATIKGIGVKRAAAIVKYRKKHGPFRNINELTTIRGINNSKIQKIRSQITLDHTLIK